MEQNILLHRTMEELILEKQEAIDLLKELFADKSLDNTPEELLELKTWIEKLEKEIDKIDDDRYLLVNKDDNTIVAIDFWKNYQPNHVVDFNRNDYHLIEVSFTDKNDNVCICLMDFDGKEIVSKCKEYQFVGKEIMILQTGDMRDTHYDSRDEEFWSIVGSDEIEQVKSIEYFEEYPIFLVNDTDCYDENLNLIGEKIKEDKLNAGYLRFMSEDKKMGIWSNGEVLLDPEYSSINHDTFDDYDFFITKKHEKQGIAIYLDNKLQYQEQFYADSITLLDANNSLFLIYTKRKDDKPLVIVYDRYSKKEGGFVFDDFFQMETIYLLTESAVFCGTNKALNSTTVILTCPVQFDSSEKSSYCYTLEGTDVKKIVSDFLGSKNIFRSLLQ